jgi:IS30 family transposase
VPERYQHLTETDRIFLRIMLERRYPKNKIAQILGVHRSTIYREVKRNTCTHWYSKKKFYWSCFAQEKYLKRRKRPTKLTTDINLKDYIH